MWLKIIERVEAEQVRIDQLIQSEKKYDDNMEYWLSEQ
jgi:hypothetical protein